VGWWRGRNDLGEPLIPLDQARGFGLVLGQKGLKRRVEPDGFVTSGLKPGR